MLPIKDINKINYYIKICEVQNLSVRELRGRIKSKEYERLDENIKLKLTNSKEENNIRDFIKHPIVIRTNKNIVSEKLLHQVILENIYIGGACVKDDYYIEIKNKLINNEVYKKVKDYSKNRNDLSTYYEVGKLLVESQGGEKRAKYGDNLIKEYSKKLSEELGKGYSQMNLKNMRKFYLLQKRQTLSVEFKLTWSHYIELLKFNDTNEIKYYIKISIDQNLSYRELHILWRRNY